MTRPNYILLQSLQNVFDWLLLIYIKTQTLCVCLNRSNLRKKIIYIEGTNTSNDTVCAMQSRVFSARARRQKDKSKNNSLTPENQQKVLGKLGWDIYLQGLQQPFRANSHRFPVIHRITPWTWVRLNTSLLLTVR